MCEDGKSSPPPSFRLCRHFVSKYFDVSCSGEYKISVDQSEDNNLWEWEVENKTA